MIRAVLDANVFVSAAIRPEGPPGQIIHRLVNDLAFTLVVSPTIVAEVSRALTYSKVRRYIRSNLDPQLWFEGITAWAHLVTGESHSGPISRDPDDDKYLVAAIEGRAHFIVAGDADLLDLKQHGRIHIVNPRTFLNKLTGST